MQKNWEKPELIVLLRGQPEEVLTTGCKVVGTPAPGAVWPQANNNGCGGEALTNCGVCQSRSGQAS